MTEREWRLRKRIDDVSAERDFYKRLSGSRRKLSFVGWCVFCGAKTKGYANPSVCRAHSDLPALDPHYTEAVA